MDSINELKIDPEFADKIPPLTPEEFERLEANILSEGEVLSPLIVWNNVIIDGHNRFRILQKHPEIPYSLHPKDFADRFEAIIWICRNQLGRRNLTPDQKRYVIGKQYEAEKSSRGGVRQQGRSSNGQFTASLTKEDLRSPDKTSERIAAETNTSRSYVESAERYARGVDAAEEMIPGIKVEILSGSIKTTRDAVTAIARASPEDRPQMVEELRNPRPSRKRKRLTEPPPQEGSYVLNKEESEQEPSEAAEEDTLPADTPPVSALSISEGMASSPDREKREASVQSIIAELTDALESMIFRWNFSLSENRTNASHKECRSKIRELATIGIKYLKSHQGG
jgi:hypothetical protein